MVFDSTEMIWEPPPPVWRLESEEVHVWLAFLDQPANIVADLERVLSPDERQKAYRMRFPKDRDHTVVARGILRHILAKYLRIDPAEISFAYNNFGKPSLPGNRRPFFNLSHSGSRALYAVTNIGNVGIDLEEMRHLPDAEELARTCFTVEEQNALRGQNELAFFKMWTRKEARAKCDGRGIAEEISPEAAPYVYEVNPGFGYAGALALNVAPRRIQKWHWPQPHPVEDTEFTV